MRKFAILFAVHAFPIACADAEDLPEHWAVTFEDAELPIAGAPQGAQGPSSDPAYHTEYQVCWSDEVGNVQGRIYWPSTHQTSCSQTYVPGDSPLVVLTHGNGYGYDEYDEILQHLAANGFFAASVEANTAAQTSPGNYIDVAEEVVGYIDWMSSGFWLRDKIDFDSLGLLGHSRGGELVSYIAQELYPRADRTVLGAVAMAPQNDTEPYLYGYMAPAYMVLYGGIDGDVPIEHPFRHHDWAGFNEWSSEFNPWSLHRVMKYMRSFAHPCYSDRSAGGPTNCVPKRERVRGYLNAFFRHHVMGDDTFYEDYIRANEYPGSDTADVWTQYSDNDRRRVVDNFERTSLSPSAMGGSVVTYKATAFTADAVVGSWSPHSTYVLMFWSTAAGGYVRWDIPAGSRDATGERYLSFRLAAAYDDTPGDVKVWLRNGSVYSWVYLADYLDAPTFPIDGIMSTVRIPLSDFGSHHDVRAVYFQLSDGSDAWEPYILDSLEFSEPA